MTPSSDSRFSLYAKDFDMVRFACEPYSEELSSEPYRTEFRRDYARLLHSPSFRRLNGKTQLYPNNESDFFRNRLTHSLEVAQIAKSIAIKLNYEYKFPSGEPLDLDTDLVEVAALCHDLGHPPFGHQGEEALDKCMVDHGGFEGNAQTLRIISKIEKKFLVDLANAEYGIKHIDGEDVRVGLNFCARTIASILKYDNVIPEKKEERLKLQGIKEDELNKLTPVKGYYKSESSIVDFIKAAVLRGQELPNDKKFKTVECQIMDIADDIAYSTYDLEDGLKAGFFDPLEIIFSKEELLKKIASQVSTRLSKEVSIDEIRLIFVNIFDRWLFPIDDEVTTEIPEEKPFDSHMRFMSQAYRSSKNISKNGYSRVSLTSYLVGRFIRGIKLELDQSFPQLSKVYFDDEIKVIVEVIKIFNYESIILSPRLKIAEFRGQEIVERIFNTIKDHNEKGYQLMPKDYQKIYLQSKEEDRYRIICDFISGMTDRYCIEFYGRLTSELPETIFKPF